MVLLASDALSKLSRIIPKCIDQQDILIQLSKITHLIPDADTYVGLIKIFETTESSDGYINPEAIFGMVRLLLKTDESQVTKIIIAIKNLLELEFKDPSRVLSLLMKYEPQVTYSCALYWRKIAEKANDKDQACKNLSQIVDAAGDFLQHLAYAVDYVDNTNSFLDQLRRAIQYNSDLGWEDTFTQGQMRSKQWLIAELSKIKTDLGVVFVEGGWVGSLSYFLGQHFSFTKIRSFDIDPQCARAADLFNMNLLEQGWKFKAATRDMFDPIYERQAYSVERSDGSKLEQYDKPDLIINTSSEHVDFQRWLTTVPQGTMVILQNNNFLEGKGHISCQPDLETFIKNVNLTDILFSGVLKLEKYDRYMIIGIK